MLCALTVASCGAWANPSPQPFSTEQERCIVPASLHHGVNYHVLRAILKIESGLKPQVSRNRDGSVDIGIGQTNSIHLSELKKFDIGPGDLMDVCVGTYVAAWHLRKAIAERGNTWYGIATYHSKTPSKNWRYQILLRNELIRSGALDGTVQAVPPLSANTPQNKNATQTADASKSGSVVVDGF